MNLQHQIKSYRTSMGFSQDKLAEKIYVSRQTISNWETGKSYPDVHSLILMGKTFNISLDELVKGDIEVMKKTFESVEVEKFKQLSNVFTVLLAAVIIVPIPLFYFLHWVGVIIFAVLFVITMVIALRIEKLKKKYRIQTYREIVDFLEGTKTDDMIEESERMKTTKQSIVKATVVAILTLVIGAAFIFLLHFSK